jgi:hypothetical protein
MHFLNGFCITKKDIRCFQKKRQRKPEKRDGVENSINKNSDVFDIVNVILFYFITHIT